MKTTASLVLIVLSLICFGLLPTMQAVSPPPDGGYPGGNTAEGQNALLSLTTGNNAAFNTALGFVSLLSDTTGRYNTAVGAGALLANTDAEHNTATGAAALLNNTGGFNTANGSFALSRNTTGSNNTAMGLDALFLNTTGNSNAAIGDGALGQNTTGSDNVALGSDAGDNQTTGSNNVYIGFSMQGVAGENNACYIASIFGQTSPIGIPVLVNGNNKLGTTISSKRFKEDIKPMDKASEALLALKPVTFRYKKEFDPARASQFGLVAEDVEKVNPDLIVRDKEGKPYSVRYDQVNAMLLNEFLKEHSKVENQGAIIAKQQKQIEALTAGLQKVSAQPEVIKPAPQTVLNNQ